MYVKMGARVSPRLNSVPYARATAGVAAAASYSSQPPKVSCVDVAFLLDNGTRRERVRETSSPLQAASPTSKQPLDARHTA